MFIHEEVGARIGNTCVVDIFIPAARLFTCVDVNPSPYCLLGGEPI